MADNIKIINQRDYEYALLTGQDSEHFVATLNEYSVGINEAGLSDEAASAVFTDILDKMPDVDIDKLHNGKVSVFNGLTGKQFNDGEMAFGMAATSVKGISEIFEEKAPEGTIKVTVNFRNSKNPDLTTVSNVQNGLGVHEFIGHGEKGYRDVKKTHHKAYELQFKHSSWEETTPDFKKYMRANYRNYIRDEKN